MLRESPTLLSTSAPPPASFLDAIHRAAEKARAVLCMTVASRFSASFDSAKTAATEAEKTHRGLKVAVLDSGSAAGGEGLIALEAWKAASRGEDLERVRDTAQRIVPRVRLLAVSSLVVTLWLLATGASFTDVIEILTVAVLEFAVPSFTLNVNESLPVALPAGV